MVKEKLDPKRELFCQLYASDKEFFGNGVATYIEVYEPDQSKPNWYKSACASASQILSNIKVLRRINELLEEQGLNNPFVDKQLGFLITQHADFTNKLGAIKEYNKLKSRIIEKVESKVEVESKSTLDDSQKAIISEAVTEGVKKAFKPSGSGGNG